MRRKRKMDKNLTWLRIMGVIVLFFMIGAGVYLYNIYTSVTKAVETMHEPIDRETSDQKRKKILFEENDRKKGEEKDQKREPFSMLLLGVDARLGDSGRSDTMIVMTVNPDLKSTKMVSIPRDTRTLIVGKGFEDKINHAYAFGGAKMSLETVEEFLDIPIDYYVKVNMDGFADIVNAVGGVTVDNRLPFSREGHDFPKGKINLNGQEALAYVRMRKKDPNGDFGRQQRQRQVIKGVIRKGKSFSSITKHDEILEALSKNVKTNLTLKEMAAIQKHYKSASNDLQQIQIKGEGKIIDDIYYQVVTEEEKEKVRNELKTHIEA